MHSVLMCSYGALSVGIVKKTEITLLPSIIIHFLRSTSNIEQILLIAEHFSIVTHTRTCILSGCEEQMAQHSWNVLMQAFHLSSRNAGIE